MYIVFNATILWKEGCIYWKKKKDMEVVYSDLYIHAFMKSTKLFNLLHCILNNFMVSAYMTILCISTNLDSRLINILSDTLGIQFNNRITIDTLLAGNLSWFYLLWHKQCICSMFNQISLFKVQSHAIERSNSGRLTAGQTKSGKF